MSALMPDDADLALKRAALHVYRRYQREFVEAYNLCPYAKPARDAGHVREVVVTAAEPEAQLLEQVACLGEDASVEIGLLICPRVSLGRIDWERWVSRFIGIDAARHPPGNVPFAMAAFHPDGVRGTHGPESLVPYIRRTPDPTIQLVRVQALERVRQGFDEGTTFLDTSKLDLPTFVPETKSSLRARISAANERTLNAHPAEIEALLGEIIAERRKLYAAIDPPAINPPKVPLD